MYYMPGNKQFETSRERKNKKDKNYKDKIYTSKHIRQKEELLTKSKDNKELINKK